ncbi:VOC family protein [Devosia sp. PTR5]|uniref:VOC family protein n=1 Tax=Devosia oryzisoli TaxID=2774138 RepID=A0A927FXH1_9HYPH|nr:VOC family protein [Devosia oryzisoli]MBD8066914.1 VOC family protein [Devosia oryzisoli]
MLRDQDSSAIVAVSDIDRAKTFYRDVLGLEVTEDSGQVVTFRTGATRLVVYVSEYAGTNKANAVVWGVGDQLETIVSDLRDKGVTFERYEGMDYAEGIHRAGDFRMVWFKDPDGNILHLNSM